VRIHRRARARRRQRRSGKKEIAHGSLLNARSSEQCAARGEQTTGHALYMQPTGVRENAKATNPLKDLLKFGQSVWLDYIRRDLITSGELKRLIEDDGLRRMNSHPAIFEKAIVGSKDYSSILEGLKGRKDLDAKGKF